LNAEANRLIEELRGDMDREMQVAKRIISRHEYPECQFENANRKADAANKNSHRHDIPSEGQPQDRGDGCIVALAVNNFDRM
jgi:hypothetical protein